MLEKLKNLEIIDYFSQQNESKITFLEVREDDRTINRISKHLEKQNLVKKNQLDSVIQYVADEGNCKSKLLLNYFGETIKEDCDVCSYCVSKKPKSVNSEEIRNQILEVLSQKGMTSRELMSVFAVEESEILNSLKQLLEHNLIAFNSKNQYILIK